jgi:periplasmic protein CpxP/Spy
LQFFTRRRHTLAEQATTLQVICNEERSMRVRGLQAVAGLMLGAVLATAATASRALQPEPQMMLEADAGPADIAGAMMGGMARGPHGGAGRMHAPPSLLPPFIHLTDLQQDKLFELRYAQEPALHEQFKALRGAREQLHALALADGYDEARVRELAARIARASSEIELMHARMQHAAFALLTPDQRQRIDACKPGPEGMPPRGCFPPR